MARKSVHHPRWDGLLHVVKGMIKVFLLQPMELLDKLNSVFEFDLIETCQKCQHFLPHCEACVVNCSGQKVGWGKLWCSLHAAHDVSDHRVINFHLIHVCGEVSNGSGDDECRH